MHGYDDWDDDDRAAYSDDTEWRYTDREHESWGRAPDTRKGDRNDDSE